MGFFRRGRDEGVATVQAVVVDYGMGRDSGITPPDGNASRNTTAVVRIVGEDRRQDVSGRLQGHSWWLMAEGDTIPVRVDADGDVVGFDRQAVDALYGARTGEMRDALRHFSSLRTMFRDEMGLDPRQVRDAAAIARETLAAPKAAWDAATDPLPQHRRSPSRSRRSTVSASPPSSRCRQRWCAIGCPPTATRRWPSASAHRRDRGLPRR